MAVALLTREDSLAFYPILPLLGLFYAYRREQVRAWVPALARYTMALVCIWFTVWLWRLAAVPNAPQFKFGSDAMARLGNMALWTIDLSGQQDAAGLLFGGLLGLALVATTILARRDRELALLFLALTAVAVLPGNVRAVPNLLLFAISFYAIFLSVVLTALARRHVGGQGRRRRNTGCRRRQLGPREPPRTGQSAPDVHGPNVARLDVHLQRPSNRRSFPRFALNTYARNSISMASRRRASTSTGGTPS